MFIHIHRYTNTYTCYLKTVSCIVSVHLNFTYVSITVLLSIDPGFWFLPAVSLFAQGYPLVISFSGSVGSDVFQFWLVWNNSFAFILEIFLLVLGWWLFKDRILLSSNLNHYYWRVRWLCRNYLKWSRSNIWRLGKWGYF